MGRIKLWDGKKGILRGRASIWIPVPAQQISRMTNYLGDDNDIQEHDTLASSAGCSSRHPRDLLGGEPARYHAPAYTMDSRQKDCGNDE